MASQSWDGEISADDELSVSADEIEELENDEISSGEAAFLAGYNQDQNEGRFAFEDEPAEA